MRRNGLLHEMSNRNSEFRGSLTYRRLLLEIQDTTGGFIVRRLSILIVLLAVIFMVSGPSLAGETKSVTLKVEGMTCRLCPAAVKKALNRTEGVKKAKVSYKEEKAIVEYDDEKTNLKELIKVIEKAGFKATPLEGEK